MYLARELLYRDLLEKHLRRNFYECLEKTCDEMWELNKHSREFSEELIRAIVNASKDSFQEFVFSDETL